MMKKLLLTLMLFAIATMGFAQTTYYWAGGTTASTLTGSDWSTTLGGAASTSRNAADDVLVFDNKTVVFSITSHTTGKLVIQNGSDITFTRDLTAATGTSSLTLAGVSSSALEVNNSKLRINGSTANQNFTLALGAAGTISNVSEVYITGTSSNRFSATTAGALTFNTGTSCFVNSGVQPFNTFTSLVNDNSVFFDDGSTLTYQGGLNPFGNTTTGNILKMAPTSNFVFELAFAASGFLTNRLYGNILVKSGVTLNLVENFVKVNNLTIETGATFNLRTSGAHPIAGNLIVNGTLGVNGSPTSSQLIMAGTSPQTISGSGIINALGCFSVANDANVTLTKNLVLNGTSTSNIIGRLNFGTSVISGTCNVQFRTPAILTDANGSTTLYSNTVTMTNATTFSNLSPTVGLLVSGTGIPANSYIVATASGSFSFTISNYATASGTGISITTTSGTPTLSTSNSGGPDASLTTTGNGASASKSIGSGTNLIIGALTTSPLPTTFFTSALSVPTLQSNISFGNVTINANATTNTNATVSGTLTFGSSKLTIRTGDELTMSSTSSFAGMGANAYLVTAANTTTGAVGLVNTVGQSNGRLFPVGSPSNYLPVTLNPANSSDFSVNVFEGLTDNATPNGTALTAAQKLEAVNAVWNVNRTSGTGNCTVSLGWTDALEGANFSGTEPTLGVSQYTTSYSAFSGTASSSTNMASVTATNDALGGFIVGKNTTLPVTVTSFTAKAANQTAILTWVSNSEVNLDKYSVQRSVDGVNFETIGSVKANNKSGVLTYSFVDKAPTFGANYYQLVSIDLDGTVQNKGIVSVNFGAAISLSVYPNPTTSSVNLTGLVNGDVVSVSDLVGRVLKTQTYRGENVMNLSLDSSNAGIYLISVARNGRITSTTRVIKN
jgi:hypothetical protein